MGGVHVLEPLLILLSLLPHVLIEISGHRTSRPHHIHLPILHPLPLEFLDLFYLLELLALFLKLLGVFSEILLIHVLHSDLSCDKGIPHLGHF